MLRFSKQHIERFYTNCSYIAGKYPSLIQQLERVGGEERLIEARDGGLTVKIGSRYIESRITPKQNAVRFAKEFKKRGKSFIFLGCGLGYHINELLGEGCTGVLVEQDLSMFRAALYVIDPPALSKLKLWIGIPMADVFKKILSLSLMRMVVVAHPVVTRISAHYYGGVEGAIRKRSLEQIASEVTVAESQKLWVKNIIENFSCCDVSGSRYLLQKQCLGRFSGPALLIASGPWLEEITAAIERYQRRCPILVLLPSVPYLLAHGIDPDLVLTTDAGFWNRYRAAPVNTTGRRCAAPLVTTFSCDPGVTKSWSGNVYLFSHALAFESLFTSVTSNVVSIPMQGTSSLVMILLARMMGFDTIFLAGYDFAFRGLRDHHCGAGFDTRHMQQSSRFSTWETRVFNALLSEGYREASDQEGRKVYTSYKHDLYKSWFEQEVVGEDTVRINNGLRVEGVRTAKPDVLGECGTTRTKNIDIVLRSCSRRLDPGQVLEELRTVREKIVVEKEPVKQYELVYGKSPSREDRSTVADAVFALGRLERSLELIKKRAIKGE